MKPVATPSKATKRPIAAVSPAVTGRSSHGGQRSWTAGSSPSKRARSSAASASGSAKSSSGNRSVAESPHDVSSMFSKATDELKIAGEEVEAATKEKNNINHKLKKYKLDVRDLEKQSRMLQKDVDRLFSQESEWLRYLEKLRKKNLMITSQEDLIAAINLKDTYDWKGNAVLAASLSQTMKDELVRRARSSRIYYSFE